MSALTDLIDSLGPKVRPTLYEFLCDQRRGSDANELLDDGTAAALKFLVPLLTKKLGLSKTMATRTAKFILETLAVSGREKLCAELGRGQAALPRRKPKKRLTTKKRKPPSPRRKRKKTS
ncbi:MAG: hypothetical protein JNL09_02085 [Anaerolineales bacterium]|nr:hypothetical protein [Anaerolineales bacterium]